MKRYEEDEEESLNIPTTTAELFDRLVTLEVIKSTGPSTSASNLDSTFNTKLKNMIMAEETKKFQPSSSVDPNNGAGKEESIEQLYLDPDSLFPPDLANLMGDQKQSVLSSNKNELKALLKEGDLSEVSLLTEMKIKMLKSELDALKLKSEYYQQKLIFFKHNYAQALQRIKDLEDENLLLKTSHGSSLDHSQTI